MQTCTVAVTGDSHFDASANGRLDECVRVHDWMLEDWARRGVDLILHGGDMYERKSVPADRNAAAAWVSRAADIAPVIIGKGNHDVPRDLEVFRKLEGRHFINVEEASGITTIVPGERWHGEAIALDVFAITVGVVAWPRKAELLARMPERLSDMAAQHAARECQRDIFKGLRADFEAAPEGPKILLMHAMTAGAKISVGQPPAGCDFEIDLADISLSFPRVGPMAVVMGHIHKPQDWTIDEVPVIYAGSPRRTTYGEIEDKSYVLLHFERPEEPPRYWELKSWERVPIPCQRMVLEQAQWTIHPQTQVSYFVFGAGPDGLDTTNADIRFRYRFADEHRAAARAAAEQLKAQWLAAGAVQVTLDPEVIRTTRARTEIAEAHTLEAKLMMLWQAREQVPPPANRERLVTKALALEQELLSAGAVPPRSVAFDPIRHRVRGFASLTDVDVKLHDLTGPLIAVVGGNGKGKSTFLETLLSGPYRATATRKTLKWLAVPDGEESVLITSFCYQGKILECEQKVLPDASRTCKSRLLVDGETQLSTDGPTEFDAWAKQHLPPADLLYATIFGAQGSAGVIGMTAGDRKGLVLRLLGHERLELLAKRCGALAGQQETALQRLAARLSDLAAAPTAADTKAAVKAAEGAQRAANADLEAARQALDDIHAQAARAAEIAKDRAGLEEQLAAISKEQEQLGCEQRRIEAAIGNNHGLLERADEIRKAVTDLAAARARAAGIDADRKEAYAKREAAVRELRLHRDTRAGLEQQIAELGTRLNRLDHELRQLPTERDCAAAVAELSKLEEALAAAQQTTTDAEKEIADLRAEEQRLTQAFQAGEAGRIHNLRGGLGRIRDEAPDIGAARREAADTLEADVATTRPPDLTERMKPALERIAELQLRKTKLQAKSQRLHLVKQHRGRVAALKAERQELSPRRVELQPRADAALKAESLASQAAKHAETVIAGLDTEWRKLSIEIDRLDKATEHADKLNAAEARIEELQKQLPEVERKTGALNSRHTEITADIDRLPEARVYEDRGGRLYEVPRQMVAAKIDECQRRLQIAAQVHTDAGENLGRARAAHERAVADLTKAQQLQAERRTVEQELADYKRLAADFGRNGIQALEIDAAGPRLTELANKLLHECHGPRFSVEVQTQRLDSSGKREIEDFVWMVTDAEKGRTGPVETLSGGEKTIVGEALRWAHTLLGADGEAVPFVARDEPAGALSPENRIAYIKMLRAAAALAGTERVLFVSHQEELSEAADSRLLVDNGTVRAI